MTWLARVTLTVHIPRFPMESPQKTVAGIPIPVNYVI